MTLAEARPSQETSYHEKPRTLLQRAFFTKESALKIMLNSRNECYFQWGWKAREKWSWKKVKFNDAELGEMLLVLDGKKDSISFFHSYDSGEKKLTTQIWMRSSNDFCTLKVQECSKGLNPGEQMVLATLIRHIIVMMSLSF